MIKLILIKEKKLYNMQKESAKAYDFFSYKKLYKINRETKYNDWNIGYYFILDIINTL